MNRWVAGISLGATCAVLLFWNPSVRITGHLYSAADSTGLNYEPIYRVPPLGERQVHRTDENGRFVIEVPLFRKTVVSLGGMCHVGVEATIYPIQAAIALPSFYLQPKPGGRYFEHTVCPASEEEHEANKTPIQTILASRPVREWLASWVDDELKWLATSSLTWGSRISAGGREFWVMEPAGFGVMGPFDGSPLLDFHFKPDGEHGGCAVLRAYFALPGRVEPEALALQTAMNGDKGVEVVQWHDCY